MIVMHNPYTNVTVQITYKFITQWRKLGFFILRNQIFRNYKTNL